jgi:hypothetical protein
MSEMSALPVAEVQRERRAAILRLNPIAGQAEAAINDAL